MPARQFAADVTVAETAACAPMMRTLHDDDVRCLHPPSLLAALVPAGRGAGGGHSQDLSRQQWMSRWK
jgi:hypothetical protein